MNFTEVLEKLKVKKDSKRELIDAITRYII